jgi:hypothetical protein
MTATLAVKGVTTVETAPDVEATAPMPPRMCRHGRWAEHCLSCALAAYKPRRGASSAGQGGSSGSGVQALAEPHQKGRFRQVDVTVESTDPKPTAPPVRHVGGRPPKHATKRAAHTAAQRAYCARQRAGSAA